MNDDVVEPNVTPEPAPEPPVNPEPPQDPEFDLGESFGGKVKRSMIEGWKKNHEAYENIEPLRNLDSFLSRGENKNMAEAIQQMVGVREPEKITQVLDLLAGKLKLAPETPPEPVVSNWEKDLDLTDPNIKSLVGALKGLQGELTQIKDSHGKVTKDLDERSERERQTQAEERAKKDLEDTWTNEKFSDLVNRVHPDHAKDVESELRNRLLYAVLQSKGALPMREVAKTLHGRTASFIDGIIKAQAQKARNTPPQGGGRGPAATPAPQPKEDDLGARIQKTLESSAA